jgi:hypothetical protein
MLYEMVTGKQAFEGPTAASVIAPILSADPPPASSLQPLTPPALDRLISRCLAKDPDDRWASAHDVAEAGALRDEIRKSQPAGQDPPLDWELLYVHLAEGDRAGAERLADAWWKKEPKTAELWGMVAQMYGALDDAERVVESSTRMIEQCGNPNPCTCGTTAAEQFLREPCYFSERVRNDPRMLDLGRRLRAGK